MGYEPDGYTGRGHLRLVHPLLVGREVTMSTHGGFEGRALPNLLAQGRREVALAEARWESMHQRLQAGEALDRIAAEVAHAEGITAKGVRGGYLAWQERTRGVARPGRVGRPVSPENVARFQEIARLMTEDGLSLEGATGRIAKPLKQSRPAIERRFLRWVDLERSKGDDPLAGIDQPVVEAPKEPPVEEPEAPTEAPPAPEAPAQPDAIPPHFQDVLDSLSVGFDIVVACTRVAEHRHRSARGLRRDFLDWIDNERAVGRDHAPNLVAPPKIEEEPVGAVVPLPEPEPARNGGAHVLTPVERTDLVAAMRELLLPGVEAERDLAVEALESARKALLQSQAALAEITAALEQLTIAPEGAPAL
jgi:hypothetical protein